MRLIDADTLIENLKSNFDNDDVYTDKDQFIIDCIHLLDNTPTVEPERPQGKLKEYKPLEHDYNVQCAVENLKMAYWSNETEKYAKTFTDAEEIIVNAICHSDYIVCKRPQGDLISREALKRDICNYLASFMNGDVIGDIVKIIDNAPTYNEVWHKMATAEGFCTNPTWNKGDLISREALKKAIETYDKFACLPDCKLEPVRNLEHPEMFVPYIHFDDVIKAIDNAPTVDVRDRKVNEMDMYDFRMFLRECKKQGQYDELVKILREENIIQPEEIPQGEWVYHTNGYTEFYTCNKCNKICNDQDKFCKHCGADMRGDEK